MKKAEIGIAAVALIGFLFLICHYPGSSILLIVSFSALAFIYMASGLKNFNRFHPHPATDVKQNLISMVSGLALAIVLMGTLYRLMLWPGDGVMLTVGLPLLAVVLVAAYFSYSKDKSAVYSWILMRAAVVGIIGLCLFVTPDDALIDFRYKNHPDYAKAYKAYRKDKGNKELKRKLDAERDSMMIKYRIKEHEQQ